MDRGTYDYWVNIAHLVRDTEKARQKYLEINDGHINQIICGGYNIAVPGGQGFLGHIVHNNVKYLMMNNIEPDRTEHATLTCEEAYRICRTRFQKMIGDIVASIAEAPDTLYRAEIARRLGVNKEYNPNNNIQNNIMRFVMELVPGIRETKLGSKKVFRMEGPLSYKIPNSPPEFKYTVKSTMEERAHWEFLKMGFIVDRESKEYLSEMVRRSPWDLVVYTRRFVDDDTTKGDLVGMIEVDGEHHYVKDTLFNREPGRWEQHQAFDREKDRLAREWSERECLRIRGGHRMWSPPKLEQLLANWLDVTLGDDA